MRVLSLYFSRPYRQPTLRRRRCKPENAVKFLIMTLLAFGLVQYPATAATYSKSKTHVKKHSAKVHAASYRKVRTHAVTAPEPDVDASGDPALKSAAALVIDQAEGRLIYGKNTSAVQPIASITKLMTAMVVLDSKADLQELVQIDENDLDNVKHTRSRLPLGTTLVRDDLLRLALMASENRAASALGRTAYPGGGLPTFVNAMNQKAFELGMRSTHFVDSTGLSSENVSTAEDLAKMVTAAYNYPLIQQYTTMTDHAVLSSRGRLLRYSNSNGLVRSDQWHIGVSKTGYIAEAGRCLVMQAQIAAKPMIIVLLDSWGKQTRIGDANRIKKWIESHVMRPAPG
jgi:D-alanyl-D-alanine endopeptidase (penicillin-binding protein 7)